MISCTEFIPLYSEFFKFCEKKGGKDAVMDYWIYLPDTNIGDKENPHSLAYKCEKFGGFGGAIAYWGHTLTEEACDFIKFIDSKNRVIYSHMRHCPSRGMLNSLSHVEPYLDYCSHCRVIYQRVLEKYGIVYERDHRDIDKAECRSLLYEVGNRPDFDYHNVTDSEAYAHFPDKDVKILDLKTEDNKYLHRDFHLIGDNALKYCGEKYGREAVAEFLFDFANNYYSPLIKDIKEKGLSTLEVWFKKLYEVEEASELLHTDLSENKLTVFVEKSPAIEYMHTLGKEPSEFYIEETRTLYKAIAELSGYKFSLEYYRDNGETKFIFTK